MAVFLPEESHGPEGLEAYSPQGRKQSDPTEATYHAQSVNAKCCSSGTEKAQLCYFTMTTRFPLNVFAICFYVYYLL